MCRTYERLGFRELSSDDRHTNRQNLEIIYDAASRVINERIRTAAKPNRRARPTNTDTPWSVTSTVGRQFAGSALFPCDAIE